MPEAEVCIKQANREDDWWICSSNEAQNVHKLLAAIKKSGKKEKVVYENANGDKMVLEGSSENDIIIYKESDPSVKRMIIPFKAPKHKGFEKPGLSKSVKSSKSVKMRVVRASKKTKRGKKSKMSKKSKRW
jgi:hypothetical protein